jgi:23S rRNA (guanosine2251-2'-O)-methyltransferase
VLEALTDERVTVDKVLLASNARADEIVAAAGARGVALQRVSPAQVTRVSRNGRHDQGVVADVVAPAMRPLADFLAAPVAGPVLLLDGITNPANLGMILRTATAAGAPGVVVPRYGVAELGPLVIKASAGVAFGAPILRAERPDEAAVQLQAAGYRLYGLAGDKGTGLFEADLVERSAFVLGNETDGISGSVANLVDEWVAIPLAGGVESLNVAVAAGIVCFEVVRRR